MKNIVKTTVLIFSIIISLGSLAVPAMGRPQQKLTDSMIKTLVDHKLIKHHLQQRDNIQVSVADGTVTLNGTVLSLAQKEQAEKDAYDVDDVTAVENNLAVEAGNLSDQQIADDIARKLRSYAFYDIFDWIQGDVVHGAVTLTGWVREPWRKTDYEKLATKVEGVKSVNNEIQILPNSIFDDQLRVRLARLLYGNLTFERYAFQPYPPIHIIVNNGRVSLEGTVNSKVERQLAETIARSETLNLGVINNLTVETDGPPR